MPLYFQNQVLPKEWGEGYEGTLISPITVSEKLEFERIKIYLQGGA
jgi:hypothetical protein